ncbi:hypothetical protein K2Q16_03305 [Patescibacteria group bacterium]|nr:hypothetical protein [Patescibacteria group bacterium]
MPRREPLSDEETIATPVKRVRRAPRKKIVEEESVSEGEARTATERVEEVALTAPPRARRKAPTRRAPEPAAEESTPHAPVVTPRHPARPRVSTFIMVAVFLGAIGVSAALGFSDKGTIDVAAKLQEQGQIQANLVGEGSGVAGQVVPVQNTPVEVPNGGLSGRGVDSAPSAPSPADVASTTASSTESGVATSTDAVEEAGASEEEDVSIDESASTETPSDSTTIVR